MVWLDSVVFGGGGGGVFIEISRARRADFIRLFRDVKQCCGCIFSQNATLRQCLSILPYDRPIKSPSEPSAARPPRALTRALFSLIFCFH